MVKKDAFIQKKIKYSNLNNLCLYFFIDYILNYLYLIH